MCIKVLLSAFLLIFSNIGFAQVPTDQQIDPSILKDMSPSALQNFLRDKNQAQSKPGEDVHRKTTERNDSKVAKDSVIRDDFRRRVLGPEDVWGSDVFQYGSVFELAELSTPPLDYPIGVGDHLVVALWGGADFEIDYEVARDGSIFPQGLGKITVQGLTFENARSVIIDRFRRVTPASTNISVSMGQPRSVVVNVAGEVKAPAPVVVSSFTNAINVIAMAGGITDYGNLRNIYIKRNNRIIDSLDIYKYITRGEFGKHLYLENNDFIIVPVYDKKVLASGQFKRPMYYQLKPGEGFLELKRYAGGLTPDAYSSGGIIIRTVNEKQTIKNVNFNAIGMKVGDKLVDEPLYNGDVVVINPINAGLSNKVIIQGEVAYPNTYEIRKGDRLFDVINRAGGITPNAYTQRAYIYKGAGDSTSIKSDKIDVNLADLNKNLSSPSNIPIEANDVIEIFNRNQFVEPQYVTIEGEVRTPIRKQRYGGMTLKDLIYFANGLKPSADFGRIEITSIVDLDSAKNGLRPSKTVNTTYNILPNLELDSVTEKVLLKPYDQVYVRKNPSFELQQNVILEGQLKYPGTYSKLSKNERISSFISRAGGISENANIGGSILYRLKNTGVHTNPLGKEPPVKYIRDSIGRIIDSVVFIPDEPIAIDLYQAMAHPNSKYDLVLQENDILFVPEINPVVSVKGAVQSKLKIYFDKEHTNVAYYIDKAGGFSEKPWKKRIYVTYANGRSKRTKNFGFFHFYPRVEEGSLVIVPVKPDGKGASDFATQIITTAMPVVLATIIAKLLN